MSLNLYPTLYYPRYISNVTLTPCYTAVHAVPINEYETSTRNLDLN